MNTENGVSELKKYKPKNSLLYPLITDGVHLIEKETHQAKGKDNRNQVCIAEEK